MALIIKTIYQNRILWNSLVSFAGSIILFLLIHFPQRIDNF